MGLKRIPLVLMILRLWLLCHCLLHAVSFLIYVSCFIQFWLCSLFVESISTNSAGDFKVFMTRFAFKIKINYIYTSSRNSWKWANSSSNQLFNNELLQLLYIVWTCPFSRFGKIIQNILHKIFRCRLAIVFCFFNNWKF